MAGVKQVALILDLTRPYDRQVVAGIARYVRQVAHWSLYAEDDPLAKIPDLRKWRGDGIIANLDDAKVERAVRGLRVPVVGIGGAERPPLLTAGSAYVTADNEAIARMAAEHLLERGLRHLAYVGLPRDARKPWVHARARAFADAAARHGCTCASYFGELSTARQWERLVSQLGRWLASLPTPVGVMACHDGRARHVMEAARRIGRRVPDDIAVVGVDNDEMICELADPPLSSVMQGTERIGYTAAATLDGLMAGQRVGRRYIRVPPVHIVTRPSTDITAIGDADLAAALRYIRGHSGSKLRVAQVARHVSVSLSTLNRRFTQALGRTAHAEIVRCRLAAARRLLLATELPQKLIARRVGFSSVQHMSAAFGQHERTTPGSVRETAGG